MPKTPEQWLEETVPQKKQAIVKLFLGYAPGVGKTFKMLSEGIRRHGRGEDVAYYSGRVRAICAKGLAKIPVSFGNTQIFARRSSRRRSHRHPRNEMRQHGRL